MVLSYLRRVLVTFVLIGMSAQALLLWTGSALAAPTEADKAKARALMDEGDRHVERVDHLRALTAYEEAHRIMGVPTTGIEVVRTLAALGRLIEARDVALAVARIPMKPQEPRVFTEARTAAAELAENLAQRIPSLTLDVRGRQTATNASASIDGVTLPTPMLALPRKLDPGPHTIIVSAPGYATQTRTVTLDERERKTLQIDLVPAQTTQASRPFTAPPPPAETGAGDSASPLVWVGFGVGAAGLVVGGVAGAMSLSRASSAKEVCRGDECPPSARDDIEASQTLANVSNVGFAVGVLGIGLGVYGLVSSGGAERPAYGRRIEPIVGVDKVGVRGRF
jgi:hypothetical protein